MTLAKLIKPMPAQDSSGSTHELPIGAAVKRITLGDHGFTFEARNDGAWRTFTTTEDLPAFTDKGTAQRLEPRPHRGRPPRGKATMAGVQPVAVRLDEAQRTWVRSRAIEKHVTVSEYIRGLLLADGLPL